MGIQRWLGAGAAAGLAALLLLGLAAGLAPASSASSPRAPAAPAIILAKTVGTDPAVCATRTAINVPAGTAVSYCFLVRNTGTVTLTLHTLTDSHLGPILNGLFYELGPGAAGYLTQTVTITESTLNEATWTAYNPGPVDTAMATAQAHVVVGFPVYLPVVIQN
jgi:hypothetical protein